MADTGRIVMLSFHQPSPAMFDLLDRAFLMASGRVVFTGPPAAAEEYFQRAGVPCPSRTTIAEHMLNAVSYPEHLRRLLAHVDSFGPAATTTVRADGFASSCTFLTTCLTTAASGVVG